MSVEVSESTKLTVDLKTIIAIGGLIALFGGFYYSTQHRLSTLEGKLDHVSEQLDVQSGEMAQIKRQIKKVKD